MDQSLPAKSVGSLSVGTAMFAGYVSRPVGIVPTPLPTVERLAERRGAARALRLVLDDAKRHVDHDTEPDACIWAAVTNTATKLGINLKGDPE
jgi:hypothetical protein